MILAWALNFAFGAVVLAMLLCAWRLLRGPEITDRLLALDTLYINAVVLVLLSGMQLRTDVLFEAALIIAMLGFVSTVALARHISRGELIE